MNMNFEAVPRNYKHVPYRFFDATRPAIFLEALPAYLRATRRLSPSIQYPNYFCATLKQQAASVNFLHDQPLIQPQNTIMRLRQAGA